MKKNNHGSDWFLTVLGIGFVGIGFAAHQNETLATLAYLLIGLGCGMFGHFSGKLIKWYAVKDHEELVKQMEIEAKDERNLLIAEKSKAKAYDLMTSLFVSMLLVFALMGVDRTALLFTVVIYLALQGYALYWRFVLDKRM